MNIYNRLVLGYHQFQPVLFYNDRLPRSTKYFVILFEFINILLPIYNKDAAVWTMRGCQLTDCSVLIHLVG